MLYARRVAPVTEGSVQGSVVISNLFAALCVYVVKLGQTKMRFSVGQDVASRIIGVGKFGAVGIGGTGQAVKRIVGIIDAEFLYAPSLGEGSKSARKR